jgi:SAM-dependent methyltransferase
MRSSPLTKDIYQSGDYLRANQDWHESDAGFKAAHVAEIIKEIPFPIRQVAEIGCGSGAVLAHLARLLSPETQFFGLDIAPDAIEIARKFESERIHFELGGFEKLGESCDLMLILDVFEHVPDYLGFLHLALGRARHFVFHIPLDMHVQGLLRDVQIAARNGLGHLHYFSKATALRTLEDVGYRVLAHRYTAGAFELKSAHQGIRTTLANFHRRAFFRLNPDLTVKLFGGFSMMVLAEPRSGSGLGSC